MLTNFERVLDELIEQKLAEGEMKGMERGMEQGMERGIEQGREEVAKEMLATDMPLEQIMRFTKLSREKLEQLRKKRH